MSHIWSDSGAHNVKLDLMDKLTDKSDNSVHQTKQFRKSGQIHP